METDLIELTDLVVAKASVETILSHLGVVTEKQRAGLLIRPQDARYASIRLGFDDGDLPQSTEVRQVSLVVKPEANLQLEALAKRFGPWTRVPPAPSGDLFKVRFKYKKRGFPDFAFVYVSLSDEPEKADSFAKVILIYRDEQL